MKKVIIYLIIVMLMLPTIAFAVEYSNDDYLIEIPNTFEQVIENSFSDQEGNNINIQINHYDSSEVIEYTEELVHLVQIIINVYIIYQMFLWEMPISMQKHIKHI